MRPFVALAALAVASLGSAQTVRLQLKFPKGKVERITTSTSMTQAFTAPGSTQKMATRTNQSVSMLSRVVSSNASGATVKLTYEGFAMAMSMNGKAMPNNATLAQGLRGKSISLQFAPNGSIERVIGMDALIAGAEKGAPGGMQPVFKQLFSEQSVRDMWSMMFGGIFPNRALRVGEAWNSSANFGQAPFRMGLKLRMKLLGVEIRNRHKMARIGITGTGSLDASGFGPTGMQMKADRFAISGTSFFDLDRGWMSDQSMNLDIRIVMTMASQGKKMTVPFTMLITTSSAVTPVN